MNLSLNAILSWEGEEEKCLTS